MASGLLNKEQFLLPELFQDKHGCQLTPPGTQKSGPDNLAVCRSLKSGPGGSVSQLWCRHSHSNMSLQPWVSVQQETSQPPSPLDPVMGIDTLAMGLQLSRSPHTGGSRWLRLLAVWRECVSPDCQYI